MCFLLIRLNCHAEEVENWFSRPIIALMQVKSIAEWEHSAMLSTFIKLTCVIKTFFVYFG